MSDLSDDLMDDDTPEFHGLSRRQLLASAAASAAGIAAIRSASPAAAQDYPLMPFKSRGRLTKRPNFLVIMIDEQRQPVPFESRALGVWRKQNLKGQQALMANGTEFMNHQIMSSACAPSRASFWTGQYPSLHGVTQTTGAAKSALEEDTYWLTPNTVPTMGNYFRAAGYETWYRGKWHVSDADLYIPGTNTPIPSYRANGAPDLRLEKLYEEVNRLDSFGFNGWVGPEPHGANPYDSGSSAPFFVGRDATYERLGVQTIKKLQRGRKPWLMVTSFVNPHDIVLWGRLSLLLNNMWLRQQNERSNVPLELFLDTMWSQLKDENLITKPRAQASYRDTYASAFQPNDNTHPYHQFYYALQETVDKHVAKILQTLMSNRQSYRDTIVLYVSDHGDLLGSHGGLYQKWHNAYDSVLRVPLVVHNPILFPKAEQTQVLTSHADVLPTMLGLAGLNVDAVQRRLKLTHNEVHPLVGRDLSGFLLGERKAEAVSGPVYFMTDDEPTRGDYQLDSFGRYYESVVQPNHIEAVVAQLPTGAGGSMQQWKFARYFDNDQFWSAPGQADIVTNLVGSQAKPGEVTGTTTVKVYRATAFTVTPPPDEYELYNMTADPLEIDNLAGNPAYAAIQAQMANLLVAQRDLKRIYPSGRGAVTKQDAQLSQGPVPARPTGPQQLVALDIINTLSNA